MKKKPFLLLEVLLAILLVSLCMVPLVQSPVQAYRFELQLLEEMEGERLAEWTFSEIKQKLLQGDIPWQKLPSLNHKTDPFLLAPMMLEIPGKTGKKIERSFVLRCKKNGEKETAAGDIYRIMHIDLFFSPKLSKKKEKQGKGDYSYRILVKRSSSSQTREGELRKSGT